MKLNLKLRHKIQLIIISVSAVIFIGTVGYISMKDKKTAYNNTINLMNSQSDNFSNKIEGLINEDFAVVSTLGNAFKAYDFLPKDQWQELIHIMYREVFKANPSFYQIWDSWELQYIDSTYDKPYGRISNNIIRENGQVKITKTLRSMDGDPKLYKNNKAKNTDFITNIYADVYTEDKQKKKMMATLWESITIDGNYIGMVGLDITLDQFQKIVNNIKIKNIDKSHAFLLTHNAKYAAHPNKDSVNTKAIKNPTNEEYFNLYNKIQTGEKFSIIHTKQTEQKRYVTYAPIKISKTGMHWYLGISAPIQEIKEQANRNFIISLIVGLLGLGILSFVIYWVAQNITTPIEKITNQLKQLSQGQIDQTMKLSYQTGDEVEEMTSAFNRTIEDLNRKSQFAQQLGQGDLTQDFELANDEDLLGKSLIEMRDSLTKAREEEEKRKEEDKKRQWVNEGLAKFSDILRQNNENLEELSYDIIRNLVVYLNANQGGIFLLNDEDQNDIFYQLKAAYAYNRRKYLDKQIKPGEGLVGTCAIEQETIYMTEIPEDYIEITSGLGDTPPDSLLIVPLKMEEKVLGIVEIASLYKFEKHQIEFVEKIAENIASTIQSVRVNLKTSELLEKSQQQAEEMSSQEEEMRQNMEELQATQEESARRERELNSTIEAINNFLLKAEFDSEGNILEANQLFLDTFGLSNEEIKNKNIKDFITPTHASKLENILNQVAGGQDMKDILKFKTKSDKDLYLISSLTSYTNNDGKITKMLFIALDHTDSEQEKISMRNELKGKSDQ